MDKDSRHLVVMGASAGGVGALLEICRHLPRFFAAPVGVVLHIGRHRSLLPELLRQHGPNPALHPESGQRWTAGTILVAPPDHHMLVHRDEVLLTRGPKENHARPAIDPLFRSAALHWGPRVIGVVLSGQMDDGSAGLQAIQACGGTTIVQDPRTAVESEMPASALRHVAVDQCVPLEQIAPLLQRLVGTAPPARAVAPPAGLQDEVAINRGEQRVDELPSFADPSSLTCPDCGGSLWELREQAPPRWRCHTGHAFGALSLGAAQAEAAEHALWSSVRALREREMLLRRVAGIAQLTGDLRQASAGLAQADALREQIREVTAMAEASAKAEADAAQG